MIVPLLTLPLAPLIMSPPWLDSAWPQAALLPIAGLFQATLAADITYLASTARPGSGWDFVYGNTTDRICSGEGYTSSAIFGSWFSYYFQGTNVTAFILQSPDAAQIEVFIDNVFQTRISGYNPSVQDANSCILYQYNSPTLPYARHGLVLYHIGSPPERPNVTGYMRLNKFIHTAPDSPTPLAPTSAHNFTTVSLPSPLTNPATSTRSGPSSPPSTTAATSSTTIGPIVGGVVGGVVAFGVMILVILVILKKRKSQPRSDSPGMVASQSYNPGVDLGEPMQLPTVTPLALPAQQMQIPPSSVMSYNNADNYAPADQQHTFENQPQVLPGQFRNDSAPPPKPYYHLGGSETPASAFLPTPYHTPSPDETSGTSPPTVSATTADSSDAPLGPLSIVTISSPDQYSLPSDASNRLSSRQLRIIQQIAEQGVPGSTLATIVDSMVHSRDDNLSPSSGALPPAYVPTTGD